MSSSSFVWFYLAAAGRGAVVVITLTTLKRTVETILWIIFRLNDRNTHAHRMKSELKNNVQSSLKRIDQSWCRLICAVIYLIFNNICGHFSFKLFTLILLCWHCWISVTTIVSVQIDQIFLQYSNFSKKSERRQQIKTNSNNNLCFEIPVSCGWSEKGIKIYENQWTNTTNHNAFYSISLCFCSNHVSLLFVGVLEYHITCRVVSSPISNSMCTPSWLLVTLCSRY